MNSQVSDMANEMLRSALRREGIRLEGSNVERLAGELARFLVEREVILEAVPSEVEPQTVVVFAGDADAS